MKKVYLVAVVFALIAAFATYMFATEIDKKTTIKDADTVPVIVALRDIPENTRITEEMFAEDAGYFTTKTIVTDYAAPNYISESADMIDSITVDPIYTNEQVCSSRLVGVDDDKVALSYKLSDGMVAYSFSAGTVNGVDGYISAGDTVDVIVFEKDDDGKATTRVAYEDLKILRISNNKDNTNANDSGSTITSYSTLTVEVTEKQALKLYQIETDYNFKLVLNPRENDIGEVEEAPEAQQDANTNNEAQTQE